MRRGWQKKNLQWQGCCFAIAANLDTLTTWFVLAWVWHSDVLSVSFEKDQEDYCYYSDLFFFLNSNYSSPWRRLQITKRTITSDKLKPSNFMIIYVRSTEITNSTDINNFKMFEHEHPPQVYKWILVDLLIMPFFVKRLQIVRSTDKYLRWVSCIYLIPFPY